MNKQNYLFILCFFLNLSLFGQKGYFTIHDITDEERYMSFPVLSGGSIYAVNKINNHLQLSELEIINGKKYKSIFDRVTRDQLGLYGRKTALSYEVLSNSDRNFTIRLYQESCGMTCHYWVSYHNFNPQNGDRYSSLRDFFTEENYKHFHAYVTTKRQINLSRQIQEDEEYSKGYEENAREFLELIAESDLKSFYFNNDSIFFDSSNLLHKNGPFQGLDHVIGIPIKDIAYLLNDFGKAALLTGKNLKNFRSESEPQLHEGTIASDLGIYMLFRREYTNEDEGTTEYVGIYAYKKHGQGINLRGKEKGNSFDLTEYDDELEEKASLKFTLKNNVLKGTWTDLKTKKKLSFNAKRK